VIKGNKTIPLTLHAFDDHTARVNDYIDTFNGARKKEFKNLHFGYLEKLRDDPINLLVSKL
jgi:hypothetical protein